jgi:hypothetical protein
MLQLMARVFFPNILPVRARVDYLPPMNGRDLAALGAAGAAQRIRQTVAEFLIRPEVTPAQRVGGLAWT